MKNTIFFIFIIALTSCSHHRDVRPGAEGLHRVEVRAEEKSHGTQDAIDQANTYCEKMENNKHAAFIDEKIEYTGSMDEQTRDTLRKASKAAQVVGGTNASVERNKEPILTEVDPRTGVRKKTSAQVKTPNTVEQVGTVGAIMTSGKDYLVKMTFKCI